MKKLLVLAAIIVASVAANAASFKWTGANIYGANATDKWTGEVAIYAYATTASAADAVKVTSTDITGGALALTYDWSDATVGTTYNFYMVIEDGGKVFNSAESNPVVLKQGAAQVSGTTTVAFGNMTTATKTNAADSWQSVPEPTSGLLMLLGMAGLALRRRRA